jgi:hypothetical protein
MLSGRKLTFDEESKALYDAVAPRYEETLFQATLDKIAAELDAIADLGPKSAPLRDRLEKLRAKVTIPPDKVEAVFARALAECRSRTAAHLALPEGESFTVEQVTDKPWSAYNWYQGGKKSVIQVNVSLPIWIDRAIDLACHEGYPGHHVYNLLLETELVDRRGWSEYQVYPLFSPQSLIAEGSANYGVEVAFPGEEKTAFERDELYPLAGLDPKLAAPYAKVTALVKELSFAGNEAARRYLDGEIDAAAAAAYLERYGLYSPERAAQRVKFVDTYRSYVINYNLGERMVRDYVEARLSVETNTGDLAVIAERRWKIFLELIASPRLPSGIRPPGA